MKKGKLRMKMYTCCRFQSLAPVSRFFHLTRAVRAIGISQRKQGKQIKRAWLPGDIIKLLYLFRSSHGVGDIILFVFIVLIMRSLFFSLPASAYIYHTSLLVLASCYMLNSLKGVK